jgi:cbb3-type cytochrome oxidase subunit 3
MKRDVMQAAGLEMFAEVAIIIFFAVFIMIALRTLLSGKHQFDEASNLPLDEGTEVLP